MENLSFNLEKYKGEKKNPAHYFQSIALEAIEYLNVPRKKRSEVFRFAKQQEGKLQSVISYMKERGIKDFKYFAACMTRN